MNCSICNNRCPAGELRGEPCGISNEKEIMKDHKVERYKAPSGCDVTRFYKPKGPKEGPRKVLPGDIAKYENAPLWCKTCGKGPVSCTCSKEEIEEPVCPLCKGGAESGTCPCCD